MNLDNPLEIVAHYLLIKGMTYLDHHNKFPMMSALVCMVTHWIEPMKNHDIGYRMVMTSPSYNVVWTINFERLLILHYGLQ